MLKTLALAGAATVALAAGPAPAATPGPEGDRATVAALDLKYQAAVKANDAEAMAAILHPQMILVVGSGGVISREDLLNAARERTIAYEIQDEAPDSQTVRLYGDTAVVTARLRIKYVAAGKAVDRILWFSDTYVRTAGGWRYAFGQASLALPGA